MTDDFLSQLIIQAPTVAVLCYLLFRLDQRITQLIDVICDLARDGDETRPTTR